MSDAFYLDEVKKCVTFIFKKTSEGFIPLGTGFFVTINYEVYHTVYLVTAKHVIYGDSKVSRNELYIRLNIHNGPSELVAFDDILDRELTHEDEEVDLIAYLFFPPKDQYDYISVLTDTFLDRRNLAERNIHEGSIAFFAGLFTDFYGKERNLPVIRHGKIALITDEKINVARIGQPSQMGNFYLLETLSMGGFSGSPVFFESERITPKKIYYTPEFGFAGVIKGHYNDIREVNGIARELNSGLALVTPAHLLKEIILGDRAVKQRDRLLKDETI